jgi:hypothetical protein
LKPSDKPERRRERAQRKRWRDRRERFVTDANALAGFLPREVMSYFWDRAFAGDLPYSPGQTPIARFHKFLEEEFAGRALDIWEVATGEACQSLSKAQRLAIQAVLAERRDPGGHPTIFGGDAPRYRLGWRIADSDVALRMRRQMEAELADGLEDQVELWALGRRADRNTRRRRLRLRGGGRKEFDIAEAAGPAVSVYPDWQLELLYGFGLMGESGRDYTFVWTSRRGFQWPCVHWPEHLCWSKYHWDARPLHIRETGEGERNVNRAILKAPIPGAVADREAFRPTWWAALGRLDNFPVWRPLLEPPIIGEARPRDWRFDSETEDKSLVRRKAPWIKIGLSWISPKRLAREDQKARAFAERRRNGLPLVIRELQKIARSQGRVYTPPPRKTFICLAGRHKARPVDHWQERAERRGWVVVAAEQHLHIAPPPKKPIGFDGMRPLWRDRADPPPAESNQRRIVHQVEKPPIPANLPVLKELSRLTRKSEAELAKMRYTHPPTITAFERGYTTRLRLHRLRHIRFPYRRGTKAVSGVGKWHNTHSGGFICESLGGVTGGMPVGSYM